MKLSYLLLFYLVISNNCIAQLTDEITNELNQAIGIELISKGDTLNLGQSFPLFLTIINQTPKPIFVPEKIDVISNLYPNGLNETWDGALIELILHPTSGFSSIFQENTTLVQYVKFKKIKPNTSIELFICDLQDHIKSYNDLIDSDELKVETGRHYTLEVKYMNSRLRKRKERMTFIGESKSYQTKFYIE